MSEVPLNGKATEEVPISSDKTLHIDVYVYTNMYKHLHVSF